MTAAASLDDLRDRDRRDGLDYLATLARGEEVNLTSGYRLSLEETLAHLCGRPDGTLDLAKVARLAVGALMLADSIGNRLDEALDDGEPEESPAAVEPEPSPARPALTLIHGRRAGEAR